MLKILLVDDEPLFREYLRTSMDWASHDMEVVGEARDGGEALEEIRRHGPDVVLADIRMPRMDGIELAGRVAREHPGVALILLTAHDEFEYARRALRLGVADYVLKPIEKDELLLALLRIRDARLLAAGERRDAEEARRLASEKVLCDLLAGDLGPEEPRALRLLGDGFLSPETFHGAACIGPGRGVPAVPADGTRWKDWVADLCRAAVEGAESLHVFGGPGGRLVCVASAASLLPADADVQASYERLRRLLARKLDAPLAIGTGGWHPGVEGLRRSCAEAATALEHHRLLGARKVLRFSDVPSGAPDGLLGCLRRGDAREAGIRIAAEADGLEAAGTDREGLRAWATALVSLCLSHVTGLGLSVDEAYGPDFDPLREIEGRTGAGELGDYLSGVFLRAAQRTSPPSPSRAEELVLRAEEYVRGAFRDAGLRVTDVAAHVAVDPSHLRTVFRERRGMSVRECIVRVRLEEAKGLLAGGRNLKLAAVAEMVGYDDPAYFSRSFKGLYGVSPTVYERMARAEGGA